MLLINFPLIRGIKGVLKAGRVIVIKERQEDFLIFFI